jgi:hypothetical protein
MSCSPLQFRTKSRSESDTVLRQMMAGSMQERPFLGTGTFFGTAVAANWPLHIVAKNRIVCGFSGLLRMH